MKLKPQLQLAEVPLAPLDEVRRQRKVETKWKADFDSAKKRLDGWVKEARKPHETAARHAKIDALKASDDEKVLLKNEPDAKAAKELAKNTIWAEIPGLETKRA